MVWVQKRDLTVFSFYIIISTYNKWKYEKKHNV